jgi:hypothetical protein
MIELTKDSIKFLRRLFDAYKTFNHKLDLNGMDLIFATTEKGIPWKPKAESVYD